MKNFGRWILAFLLVTVAFVGGVVALTGVGYLAKSIGGLILVALFIITAFCLAIARVKEWLEATDDPRGLGG